MNKFVALAVLSLTTSFVALAGVKVTSVDLKTRGEFGYVNIAIDGKPNELPDIKVNGKTIEITLDRADAFTALSKNVQGSVLTAKNVAGKAVITAVLPYDVASDSVDLGWKNSNIEIVFPRGKVAKVEKTVAPVVVAKIESSVSKDVLNEDYLNKLMTEQDSATKALEAAKIDDKKDAVTLKQAAVEKKVTTPRTGKESFTAVPKAKSSGEGFSFVGYAIKFTVFLSLVLGLFYGIVQVLKKGVFSRGKLGFLNNSQMIEVLSTTYVAPKRSLMVVKVHKQVFLVANSESGLAFLSEMKDTSGLIKDSEKFVTGGNFDVNLNSAEANEDDEMSGLKLKEDILQSTPIAEPKGLAKLTGVKEIVKFSDELKKKAKKLKPIEFN